MNITIEQERADTPDALALIAELEAILEPLYPRASRHGLNIKQLLAQGVAFFVVRADGAPAGCGGVLLVPGAYAELKRMYVRPAFRGAGLGERLIERLADHAAAHGQRVLRLETGVHQHAAIRLYERAGFRRIPPFGSYTNDPLSLCYERALNH